MLTDRYLEVQTPPELKVEVKEQIKTLRERSIKSEGILSEVLKFFFFWYLGCGVIRIFQSGRGLIVVFIHHYLNK